MRLETRANDAAEALRAATTVDPEAGLARLRPTLRRRNAARVTLAAASVAAVVGLTALTFDTSERAVPPANVDEQVENGVVVSAADFGGLPVSDLESLPEAGEGPFPVWAAFDQTDGWFLYTADGTVGDSTEDLRTLLVLAPGADEPVAAILCGRQCNWHPTFGPGPDEVTTFTYPGTAQAYGFDGARREGIDVGQVLRGDAGVADLEWSPDGTKLAVSTFSGGPREPTCSKVEYEARIWLFDRSGGAPELLYTERVQPEPDMRFPVLSDLAWTSNGEHLGFISSTYCRSTGGPPPVLMSVDVATDTARTVHEFDSCDSCDPNAWYLGRHGFAWSPDGARVAVTSGALIEVLDLDGRVQPPGPGTGSGPLAWLAEQRG